MLVGPWFSRMLRFFPPVVIGSVITVIGLSLLPIAGGWLGGGVPQRPTTVASATWDWGW